MQVRIGTVPEHMDGDREDEEREAIRELMDPVALEARLVIARARRAEVLAARAEASRDGRSEQRPPAPPEDIASREDIAPREDNASQQDIAPEALGPFESVQAVEPTAEAASEPQSFPFVAGLAKLAAAKERRHRAAGESSITAAHDPDRRTPMLLEAMPGEVGPAAAPHGAPSKRRRSVILVATILLAGAALGVASTLMLQFQGWQIAIQSPAAGGGQEQGTTQEPAPAPIETTDVPRPPALTWGKAEDLAIGSTVPKADVAPPLVGSDSRDGFPGGASAEDAAPETVARPAAGEPVRVGTTPPLAPAKPTGTLDAELAGLLQSAPAPLVMKSLQSLSFNMGTPARPDLPGGAEPEGPILTMGMADMPSLLPMPQNEASPSPPPPAENAEPRPAVAVPPARIVVHFPTPSPAAADKVSAGLTDAGFADVSVYPVSISISAMQVRYYHEEDREAAENVAASTSTALDGAEVAIRSFTGFRPQPQEGLVEVWLAGEAARPVAQAAATRSARPAVPSSAARQASAAARRVAEQEAERQRLVGRIEQLLREQLR